MLSLEDKAYYLEEIKEDLAKSDEIQFYVPMYKNFLYKNNRGFNVFIHKLENGYLLKYLHKGKYDRFLSKKKNQPKYIDAEDDCGNYTNYQLDLDRYNHLKWLEGNADSEIYSRKKFKSLNKLVDFLIEKF